MIPPPETTKVTTRRVACDGATDIPGGAALGHPRVWLEIDERGYVDCGYCDRRFILIGGPADGVDQAALPDISAGSPPEAA
ncbi:zinc-finger domain-containing protein [Stakelama sp. CBK3Z-3]|uniref:Zinc-finger domain-containing protein n=1 Tax=Stakelama flava TaxID=2860338 RepID=A0ABS6XPH6_9SPHN|nr:zinc-finger domain-containing protein [Stakelama flava]MBW4331335.1 zinc-finger domain-containing protein [Stakelama flava]